MSGSINPNNFNSAAMRDAQVFDAPQTVGKKDVTGKKEASNFEGLLSGLQDRTETQGKTEKQASGGLQDQVLLEGEQKQARGREELKGQYGKSALKSQEDQSFEQNAQIASTQEKGAGEKKKTDAKKHISTDYDTQIEVTQEEGTIEKKKVKTNDDSVSGTGSSSVYSETLGDSSDTREVSFSGGKDPAVRPVELTPDQEKLGEIQVHLRKGNASYSKHTVDFDFVRGQTLEALNPNAASAVSEVREIHFPAASGIHPNVDEPASASRILGPFNSDEEFFQFASLAK
jgi:hypothetical protein